jgi:hypothetical protein
MSYNTIKRKILLENSTDRTFNSPSWGIMTASTFYINVMLTQDMDDMGLFTDMNYIQTANNAYVAPDYSLLINKLNLSGITFPFMTGATSGPMTGVTGTTQVVLRLTGAVESDYYNYGNLPITGSTDTKIEDLRSYSAGTPFITGFDMATEVYNNYINTIVSGVSRVVSISEPRIYVFDTPADVNIGTNTQVYGLQYQDYTGTTRQVIIDGIANQIPVTNFRYIGEGWNQANVSLSALTKEEYLFGIISPPIVESGVFIDRGITTVMDKHLRLSEIKDLGMLSRYGNGYYNLTKQ